MYGRSTALRPYPNRCIMKRIKLISCLLLAVLVTFCSVSTALAETYYTKDGLKYMLEENDAYLAGIAPELRTTERLLMFLRICMTIP